MEDNKTIFGNIKKYYVIVNKKAYNAFRGLEERSDGVIPNDSIEIKEDTFKEFFDIFVNKRIGPLRYDNGKLILDEYQKDKQFKALLEVKKNNLREQIISLTSRLISMRELKYETDELEIEIDTLKKQYENFDEENKQ